jgi:Predicted aminoglycoside phosphotransferase
MTKGCLIGKGFTAEVCEWGKDKVLKLYYDWVSLDWLEHEANIGAIVNTLGVSAPCFYEKVNEGGRNGLIYQRISGKLMSKSVEEEPWKVAYYAKKMARLHYQIHLGKGGALPSQKEKLTTVINLSKEQLGEKTEKIIEYLDSLPSGDNICHGDFHPANIMISDQNAVAIDWTHAYSGNPISDLARTCIIFILPLSLQKFHR